MEQKEKTRIDGFNQGYRLNLYSPELFDKLKDSLDQSKEFEGGILEGGVEADKERERQRLKQLEGLRESQEPEKEQESIER